MGRRVPQRFLSLVTLLVCLATQSIRAQDPHSASSSSSGSALQTDRSSQNSQKAPPPHSQKETDQYRLSHERYEKAVSYSRAGYTLYFVSNFLSALVLLLILRLGLAAKFRDLSICQRQKVDTGGNLSPF